ncbi:HD domain-containing phosphohydrolase [Anaeroselena agilis]|uniref:Diguanylate cyclase n=1 Tax=Anaeroselena agilis TaxID=3063788 RepID=A0ABU3P268_9FIRM|nr:diguanylate cyclase [Selenomonadales bacterium 4137-cl]
MGLGRKIAMLQVLLIVSFVGAMLLLGRMVWGESYLSLEREEVMNNVTRTRLAWEEELDILGSLVGDWAPWDDLAAFARDVSDREFVEKNLPDAQMANLKINVALVTDARGRVLFAKAVDQEKKTETKVPGALLAAMEKVAGEQGAVLKGEEKLKSFVVVEGQPVLFAMQRILRSDKSGPSPGLFVFAKYGDAALMAEISRRTQVKVAIGEDGGSLADAGREQAGDGVILQTGDEVITAYYPLVGASGEKGLFLVSTTPRDIYKQGQAQMRFFLLAAAVFGVLLTMITLLVLDRLVLARVRKLGTFIHSLIGEKDYSVRLDLPGRDELSGAAAAMNAMLAQIEASQAEITGLLDSVKRELAVRKKAEQRLLYLGLHDPLTGMFNRTYFEEAILRLIASRPKGIGVICCDLDGLKLINDSFGHSVGDRVLCEVATIIGETVSGEGFVARLGGDEFAAVMTDIGEDEVQEASRKMRREVKIGDFGGVGLKLSLSVGWAYYGGSSPSEATVRDLLKQADDFMYRRKLSSSHSNRNTLVNGMLELLKARDFITEGHSQRLLGLVVAMARRLALKESQLNDLSLLAQFHDIGKVGIADALLFKPGPLTAEERKEMERHSEIGHRIAQSVPEFVPISDFILKHHEWWNGRGYPLGLSGEEIPLECRILSIADAFDAMTSNRPYRKAMTQRDAVGELRRFAGVQFDPRLVEVFIGIVAEKAGE